MKNLSGRKLLWSEFGAQQRVFVVGSTVFRDMSVAEWTGLQFPIAFSCRWPSRKKNDFEVINNKIEEGTAQKLPKKTAATAVAPLRHRNLAIDKSQQQTHLLRCAQAHNT